MKSAIKSIAKKVTLDLIYEAVEERTAEISKELVEINKRLDRMEARQEQYYNALNARMEQQYNALNARIDQLFSIFISQKAE